MGTMRAMWVAVLVAACGEKTPTDTATEPDDTDTVDTDTVDTDTDTVIDTDTDIPVDLSSCESSAAPTVDLGRGVSGFFAPIVDMQEVGLAVAPQGGFGVSVIVHTVGLQTSADGYTDLVNMLLETVRDGAVIGTFNQLATPLLCQGDGSGGMIFGVVVGLDSTLYKTNDQLLSLNGAEVELRVTITDALGATATVSQPILLVVGN